MKGIAVIKQTEEGAPAIDLPINYVHLNSESLTRGYKAFYVAALPETLDLLENSEECVVLIQFLDKNEDGDLVYSELDQELPEVLSVFNYFMTDNGIGTFPEGTTAREILNTFGIKLELFYISDME